MLWVVLAMGVLTHLPIRQVFKHARRMRPGDKTPARSNLCEARQRLGVEHGFQAYRASAGWVVLGQDLLDVLCTRQDRDGIVVRVIEYALDDQQRTGHGEKHVLLTNLFDHETYQEENLDVDRLSFTGCLRILQARLPECDSTTPSTLAQW